MNDTNISKCPAVLAAIEEDFVITKMRWSTGLIVAVKKV